MDQFTITRQEASELVWVSVRTLDRYIERWKLSFKKVWNRVLLDKDQVLGLKDDFDEVKQNPASEIIWNYSLEPKTSNSNNNPGFANIEETLTKFLDLINEKDKLIEEKNNMIFVLQNKLGSLETGMKNVVALPDYTAEKEKFEQQKRELQSQKDALIAEKDRMLKEKDNIVSERNEIFWQKEQLGREVWVQKAWNTAITIIAIGLVILVIAWAMINK